MNWLGHNAAHVRHWLAKQRFAVPTNATAGGEFLAGCGHPVKCGDRILSRPVGLFIDNPTICESCCAKR